MAEQEDEVVVEQGRLTGCSKRSMIVLIVVGILLAILLIVLVHGLFSGVLQQPTQPM